MRKLPIHVHILKLKMSKTGTFSLVLFKPLEVPKKTNLHFSLRYAIVFGQFFAVMPIDGVMNSCLKFQWFSLKMIYTLTVIILQALYTVVVCAYAVYYRGNFFNYVVVVWNIRALIELIYFIKIAHEWPNFVKKWHEIELILANDDLQPNLQFRFKIMGIVVAFCATFEHFLFVVNGIRNLLLSPEGNKDLTKRYFVSLYREIFTVTEYQFWKALIVEILSLIATFLWSFTDFFIITLSTALALRFKQISKRMEQYEQSNSYFWQQSRIDFNRLCLLNDTLNKTLMYIVFISFTGDCYFIATTVTQLSTQRIGFLKNLYYYYNMSFQLMHIIVVSIYCSWVYEEHRNALNVLVDVPSEKYCGEIDRLLSQISSQSVSITGAGFFKFTRVLLLQAISVIVTVQLILNQFNATVQGNI